MIKTTVKQPENRRAGRVEVNCSLKFTHNASSKTLRGRCLNISDTGALVIVPLQVPVIAGQIMEISFSSNGIDQLGSVGMEAPSSRIDAVVTRIDRMSILEEAGIRVGLEFRQK